MQIEKFESAGYFTFAFEPDDWKTAKIQDMLEEIKRAVIRLSENTIRKLSSGCSGGNFSLSSGKSRADILRIKIN